MAKPTFLVTLQRVRELTPTVREFSFNMPPGHELKALAGQFVIWQVPQEGKNQPRAYSLASDVRNTKSFQLIVKLVPGGLASEKFKLLKGGEQLEFSGPFGKCLFVDPPPSQVVFVCTGAGLSQHLCFLKSVGAQLPQTRFRLLMGVWNESEIFFEDELNQLKKELKDFSYEYVLDSAGPSWKGKTGFVTQYLGEFNYKTKPTTFYLCGNPAMIKSVREHLFADGLTKESVREEAFH